MDETAVSNPNSMGTRKLKDNLGDLIWNYYKESKEAFSEKRDEWDEASDAYNAIHTEKSGKILEEAKKYEIYVQLTKRIVDNARAHISSELFNDTGQVPFKIKPSEDDLDDLPKEQQDLLKKAAIRMEKKIRKDLHITDYVEEIDDVIDDLSLLGTGITKNPVIKTINYPVFRPRNTQIDPQLEQIENQVESRKIATAVRVSPRHIFPAPGAKNPEEADYIIHYIPRTGLQLLKYVQGDYGYDKDAVLDCLRYGIGQINSNSETDTELVDRNKRTEQTDFAETEQFELMEFWGQIQISKVEKYIPEILKTIDGYYLVSPDKDKEVSRNTQGIVSEDDIPEHSEKLSMVVGVCISVVGNKDGARVIRAALTPLDDILPFNFSYWKKNNESIFGDGIHTSLQDIQVLMNFFYAQIVDGKAVSGKPQVLRRENTFGGDDDGIWAGKEWVVKGTGKLRDHIDFFAIPDTTQGLELFVDRLEREANMATLSPMQGGDNSKYQTTTARGLQLLNENNRKDIVAVVRSISSLITRDIKNIYYWIMATSQDQTIKGNYQAECTGFMDYINRVEKKNQLIQVTSIIMETQLQDVIQKVPTARNLYEMSGLDPDVYVKTEEQVEQETQSQSQLQMQMMETQVKMQENMLKLEAMIAEQAAKSADIRKEMMAASADERKRETLERVALLKEGNVLHPTSLEQTAMLLENEEAEAGMENMQKQQQEQKQIEQLEQQDEQGNQQIAQQIQQQIQAPQQQQQQQQQQQSPPQGLN